MMTTILRDRLKLLLLFSAEYSLLKVMCGTLNLAFDPAHTGAAADTEYVSEGEDCEEL